MKNFLAAILLIILSIGFYIYFSSSSSPKKILLSSKNCDLLNSPCIFNYRGKNFIQVSFSPSKINNKSPFQVRASLITPNLESVKKVELRFQGIDMNLNAFFDLFSSNEKDFIVEAKLPYCTLKKMSWKLLINFKAILKDHSVKQFFIVQDFTVIN